MAFPPADQHEAWKAFFERLLGRRRGPTMAYQDEFARAKGAARAKMAFYVHLAVYLVVNALLIAINLLTSAGHLWSRWPLLGWGIGVVVHAVVAFALPKGAGMQRRMVEREMRRSALKKS
jgi:2TM domain